LPAGIRRGQERAQQGEAPHQLRLLQRKMLGDDAAEGMADDMGAVDLQRPGHACDRLDEELDRESLAGGAAPRSRQIRPHDPIAVGQRQAGGGIEIEVAPRPWMQMSASPCPSTSTAMRSMT
jgi:hypothetical protein